MGFLPGAPLYRPLGLPICGPDGLNGGKRGLLVTGKRKQSDELFPSAPSRGGIARYELCFFLTIRRFWRHRKCWCGRDGLTATAGWREDPAVDHTQVWGIRGDHRLKSAGGGWLGEGHFQTAGGPWHPLSQPSCETGDRRQPWKTGRSFNNSQGRGKCLVVNITQLISGVSRESVQQRESER